MLKKILTMTLATGMLAGCAANVNTARLASEAQAPAPTSCTPTPLAGDAAYVVEGFGGNGDDQLIVTELRPMSRCPQAVPAGPRATLAPQQ